MALAFSCVCGILGTVVVGWYGMTPGDSVDQPKGWVTEGVVNAKSVDGDNDNGVLNHNQNDTQGTTHAQH